MKQRNGMAVVWNHSQINCFRRVYVVTEEVKENIDYSQKELYMPNTNRPQALNTL